MTESWLDELKQRLRQFAAERDWQRYHSPKNLSMALIAEAAELGRAFPVAHRRTKRHPAAGETR